MKSQIAIDNIKTRMRGLWKIHSCKTFTPQRLAIKHTIIRHEISLLRSFQNQ